MAKRVFLSYAPQDERFRADLETHVAPLLRERAIGVWGEHMLAAGEVRQATLEAQIDIADAILLLLTPDFLASKEIQDQQVQRALDRRAASGVPVVPVLVRPCLWRCGPLAELQPLPRPADRQDVRRTDERDTKVAAHPPASPAGSSPPRR